MLAALLLLSSGHLSQEPLLLKKAQLIMKVKDWHESVLLQGDYNWWSATTLVGFGSDDEKHWNPTNKKELFDVHGKPVKGSIPDWIYYGAMENFSPDHKLTWFEKWNGMNLTWIVQEVATQKEFGKWTILSKTPQPQMDQWNGYWPPKLQWSRDGKTVCQIETWFAKESLQAQVTERPLSNLKKARPYPIVGNLDPDANVMVHDGKAIVVYYNRNDAKSFPIKEWVLDKASSTMKSWTVKAPKGQVIIDYLASPDFTKAVWTMGVPSKKLGGMGQDGYPYFSVSLWTSGLHGENMRELGVIPFPTKDEGELQDYYQAFGSQQWNPDSKHVSFMNDGKLYWIAV